MELQNETGNKQHILAEDTLGNHLIPSLSDLFIARYADCFTLAVFSCIEKKLLAYKITLPVDNLDETEHWLSDGFKSVTNVSFSHLYEIVPQLFSDGNYKAQNTINDILVAYNPENPKDSVHYLAALIRYHLIKKTSNQLYLYYAAGYYNILLMNNEECLLANAFECENENEVLYFLINALQISDILPSDTTLNIDYSLAANQLVVQFLRPHFAKTELTGFSFEGINHSIPKLPEKLFACYTASLCV